jgi:SAM-dependent methyltransferase
MPADLSSLPSKTAPSILPRWTRSALRGALKSAARGAICHVVDTADYLRGLKDPLTPPCALRVRVGCFLSFLHISHYHAVGDEFVGHLKELGALSAQTRFLDIGCGCGQMAVPLTRILDSAGSYDGFDPDRKAIDWCRDHITARYGNFRFANADLGNAQYNPDGRINANCFRFPYADQSFDLILLKSIFTHLQAAVTENYFSEIRRMLAPGGRAIASFILLNDESLRYCASNKSAMTFPFDGEGCRVFDSKVPEYLVAYPENAVVTLASRKNLMIENIYPGSWCGRPMFLSFHDLVVLSREE